MRSRLKACSCHGKARKSFKGEGEGGPRLPKKPKGTQGNLKKIQGTRFGQEAEQLLAVPVPPDGTPERYSGNP